MKLVILDRDGTINRDSPDFVKSPDEFEPLPGSIEAIAALTGAGYTVVVASNQSGVGRGLFDAATLYEIHRKLVTLVAEAGGHIDAFFFCPHRPDDDCECRKPRAGMLRSIASRYGTRIAGVPVIGDSVRDIAAARLIRARPILVRTGNGLAAETELHRYRSLEVFDDLAAAAQALVAEGD